MSFPRYPEYKDSGVEWLGEVPGHWDVTALKRGFNVTLGKMLQPDSTGPDDELLPYLRAANIQWDGVDATDIKQMWLSKRDRAQLRLERGDLLVSEGGDVGRSCMWSAEIESCYFQNSVNRVRAREGHSNRYLYYWMSTVKDKGYIDVLCNKSTIAHFTAEKVAAVPVPLPTPAEQTQIAAFLDRETAKIDALVAEQRRLMALLKEKRQAVISHAVTRGLNPKAPLKPSGIEWLGDVPEHWGVVALGKVTVSRCDGPFGSGLKSEHYTDSGVRVIRLQNIRRDGFNGTDEAFIDNDYYSRELSGHDVVVGDVLIAGLGDDRNTVGRACVAPVGIEPAMVKADCFRYRMNTAQALPDFVATALSASSESDAGVLSTGSTRSRVPLSVMATRKLPLPPLIEQFEIASFIKGESSKFDTLTTEAQRAIDLLQERRTALISAAVTGQIDVRGAV